MLQDLILRTELFGIGINTHPGWLIHLFQINLIAPKFFCTIQVQLKSVSRRGWPFNIFTHQFHDTTHRVDLAAAE